MFLCQFCWSPVKITTQEITLPSRVCISCDSCANAQELSPSSRLRESSGTSSEDFSGKMSIWAAKRGLVFFLSGCSWLFPKGKRSLNAQWGVENKGSEQGEGDVYGWSPGIFKYPNRSPTYPDRCCYTSYAWRTTNLSGTPEQTRLIDTYLLTHWLIELPNTQSISLSETNRSYFWVWPGQEQDWAFPGAMQKRCWKKITFWKKVICVRGGETVA